MRLLLVTCLVTGLLGAGAAAAEPARHGFDKITFSADCSAAAGRLTVHEVRSDRDTTLVLARGTGLEHRRWYGDLSLAGALPSTFRATTPEGRLRRSAVVDVPIGRGPVGLDLLPREGDQVTGDGCALHGEHTPTWAEVGDGPRHLLAIADDGVRVRTSNDDCSAGSVWRGRLVATWPDHTVRTALPERRCRAGEVRLDRVLHDGRLPRALAVVLRDKAGHTWHASYGIGR